MWVYYNVFIQVGSFQFRALRTLKCKSSGAQMYTFLLSIYLVVELLGHQIEVYMCVCV